LSFYAARYESGGGVRDLRCRRRRLGRGAIGLVATRDLFAGLLTLTIGVVLWLAGHWHYALRHHYYTSPLAQRLFQQVLRDGLVGRRHRARRDADSAPGPARRSCVSLLAACSMHDARPRRGCREGVAYSPRPFRNTGCWWCRERVKPVVGESQRVTAERDDVSPAEDVSANPR
jgi:hypothetical protein